MGRWRNRWADRACAPMNARFRPVWLVLDPYTGIRTLIGMLVTWDAAVELVRSPCEDQGLNPKQRRILDLAVAALTDATSFDDLPMGLGPQVVLGDPAVVPAAVERPVQWVAEQILRRDEAA